MNEALISILIPAYNHAKYVQETIQSIIQQSYHNLELIIINDGSNDATWEKINEMRKLCENRFVRTIFKTQTNKGICDTLNHLLKEAQGEFVYIIASDDKAETFAIEKLYNFLNYNSEYALCVGDNQFIDENSNICFWDKNRNIVYNQATAVFKTFGEFLQKTQNLNFNTDEFGTYNTLYPRNYIPNGYLIRKSIFKKTGYFKKEAPLEDYYIMMQISKYAKMKYLDIVLFSYRWHSSNTIKQTKKIGDYIRKTRIYENKLLKNSDISSMRPEVTDFCQNGICYKTKSYIGLITKEIWMKPNQRIKKIKILGYTIFKKIKNNNE